MSENAPLVSVVILCYRKFEYLYEAIDSVLMQEYPAIEIIVSDDGSPDFPMEEVRGYIEANKCENVKHIVVRTEPENYGTVKHMNQSFGAARGDFMCALAGDDSFFDARVLSKYVKGFEKAEDDCYIEMAQAAMYDHTLQKLQNYFVTPFLQHCLEEQDYDTLYRYLLIDPCLPSASTFFKKKFFEKFGKFDEKYMLIEDYPMHLRLVREKWRIHYESFVAVKHRDGGVSHGRGELSATRITFYNELIDIVETEKREHSHGFSESDKKAFASSEASMKSLKAALVRSNGSILDKLRFYAAHPLMLFDEILERSYPKAWMIQWKLLVVGLVVMLAAGLLSNVISVSLEAFSVYTMPGFSARVERILQNVGLLVSILGLICYLVYLMRELKTQIRRSPNMYL